MTSDVRMTYANVYILPPPSPLLRTMRLRLNTLLVPVFSVLLYGANAETPAPGGELYPPGYLPLVNRANVLLSAGQFNDAARAYTEAIGESTLLIQALSNSFSC